MSTLFWFGEGRRCSSFLQQKSFSREEKRLKVNTLAPFFCVSFLSTIEGIQICITCNVSSMENKIVTEIAEQGSPQVPSLIQYMSSREVVGFGSDSQFPRPYAKGSEATPERQHDESSDINHQRKLSVSISMPLCAEVQLQPLNTNTDGIPISSSHSGTAISSHKHPSNCNYQPMPKDQAFKDKSFDSFRTWSGTLERKVSILRRKQPREASQDGSKNSTSTDGPLPVQRYFDALEGPELEILKGSEETVLPQNRQWPFLLRFPVTTFSACLGAGIQSILWKTISISPSTRFLHISLKVNLIFWFIAIALFVTIFATYLLKTILYFEAVRREYYHPIRINFFFAPWIALLFLAIGVPPLVIKNLPQFVWYILMAPILCLELKIYGQWMSGGQRRLSVVANPTSYLAVIGNFLGVILGTNLGLREGPIYFFAVGLAHYIVVFVTLYQRLPTNETLPKELNPAFLMFVAPPTLVSVAWHNIQGSFDYVSRIFYFIAVFLAFSFVVRINFFRGFTFSLTWWAYAFPVTGIATTSVRYSNEVTNPVTQSICVFMSVVSALTVAALLVSTILHAFLYKDLFPNDVAIAITRNKRKPQMKCLGHGYGSHDSKEIEKYFKFEKLDKIDSETSTP
ncbi:hypothetical protein VNO78_32932 [Psophocarpus tetragonolobus]|uniref:Uncharacterized protein n=1 Tax=Psophocarpus tetragonolobus TaxID=3891 RepID=A0AAN9P081_PSOTE